MLLCKFSHRATIKHAFKAIHGNRMLNSLVSYVKTGMELQVGWVETEYGWRRSHPTPCTGTELRKSRSEKDVRLTLNQGPRWKAGAITLGSALNQMSWPS